MDYFTKEYDPWKIHIFPSLSVGFTNMGSPSSYRNIQKSFLHTERVQTVLSLLLQQSGIVIMSHLDCISYRWSIHDLKQWEDHAHAGIRVLCKNLEHPLIGDLYIWDLWLVCPRSNRRDRCWGILSFAIAYVFLFLL